MNIMRVFRAADFLVRRFPEPFSRSIFEGIGIIAGFSNLKGVAQLRKNYQRLVPLPTKFAQRRRSSRAMRSYMRYYHEALLLPYLEPEQILARVSVENLAQLREVLAENSCSGALFHLGNWDLAGAWANIALAPVHTIAEKLQPPELAESFLNFRQSLGMTIYPAIKGGNATGKLAADMRAQRCFTPLLCDRDLSARGVEVELGGYPIRVAPGAAILAIRTNTPMFPVFIFSENFAADKKRRKQAGSKWGIHIQVGEPIYPPQHIPEGKIPENLLMEMNQAWMIQAVPALTAHLEDWHMLQKLFVADLDMERLRRAKERAQLEAKAQVEESTQVPIEGGEQASTAPAELAAAADKKQGIQ